MEDITTQPPVPVSKYAPFTYEEFKVIQSEMEAMGYWLPKDATAQRKLWMNCTRIRGKAENQPCSCKQSAGLWARCVEDINTFIKARI
jgi:hypothetical protein